MRRFGNKQIFSILATSAPGVVIVGGAISARAQTPSDQHRSTKAEAPASGAVARTHGIFAVPVASFLPGRRTYARARVTL